MASRASGLRSADKDQDHGDDGTYLEISVATRNLLWVWPTT